MGLLWDKFITLEKNSSEQKFEQKVSIWIFYTNKSLVQILQQISLCLVCSKWSKLLLNGAEMLILTESKLKWKLTKYLYRFKERKDLENQIVYR